LTLHFVVRAFEKAGMAALMFEDQALRHQTVLRDIVLTAIAAQDKLISERS